MADVSDLVNGSLFALPSTPSDVDTATDVACRKACKTATDGIAKIKAEFKATLIATTGPPKTAVAEHGEHEPPSKRQKKRGQNKNRLQFHNQRVDSAKKLCSTILSSTACIYGEKCRFSHNLVQYMENKPPDLGPICYNYETFGKCCYSFACRYAQAHTTLVDGIYINLTKGVTCCSKTLNTLQKDVQNLIRKRKYNFSRSLGFVKQFTDLVEKQALLNVELSNSGKLKAAGTKITDSSSITTSDQLCHSPIDKFDSPVADADSMNASMSAEPESNSEPFITQDSCEHSDPELYSCIGPQTNNDDCLVNSEIEPPSTVGPITNEDQFSVRPKEKKTIDFRNKLSLAPLTTVGNLPFRRLCKQFGAEVTCGEMAMASKLLQGYPSEWALIKRHSSEDLFGVQICGAFADTMAKCTQLLNETCELDFIDINCGCPIDMVFDMGAGSALMKRVNRFQEIVRSTSAVSTVPLTVKVRTGVTEKSTAHTLISRIYEWGASLVTLHGRSREQRYTKRADWEYIEKCVESSHPWPLIGNGDILSYEDYNEALKTGVAGAMIARGALIKPWIFTEIRDQFHWDISSSERLDILKKFTNYGLEHWGSDEQGVETTRRFLLEWLSFQHRYIPVGLLERVPQKINERPQLYFGRNDLETLMASAASSDWVKISEMLLGPVPNGFFFIPKHRANAFG